MIGKMSEEEIIERLETSERTVEELKGLLTDSLSLVNELHTKQREMQKEARVTGETSYLLANSIAKYISLDTEQVARAIVESKIVNKDLQDLMETIKSNVDSKLEELGSGKVTDELVDKMVKVMDVKIAELVATEIDAEEIAAHMSIEDIAYHVDAENVAYSMSVSDVAGYVDTEYVASYMDPHDVASQVDLDDLASNIDLDVLASKVKELMD